MLRWRIINILWSLLVSIALVQLNVHERLWARIVVVAREQMLQRYITIPMFLGIYFACWAILTLPVAARGPGFAFGQWIDRIAQRGFMFIIGGSLLLMCQILSPARWPVGWAGMTLVLVTTQRRMTLFVRLLIWLWLVIVTIIVLQRMPASQDGSPLLVARVSEWLSAWGALGAIAMLRRRSGISEHLMGCAAWFGGMIDG